MGKPEGVNITLNATHFRWLALLIVGIGLLQTGVLGYRQVTEQRLLHVVDSFNQITVLSIRLDAALRHKAMNDKYADLSHAITQHIAVPMDEMNTRLTRMEAQQSAIHHDATARISSSSVALSWQLEMLKAYIHDSIAVQPLNTRHSTLDTLKPESDEDINKYNFPLRKRN
jgi:phosphoglycerate-specific signal transduction histidine kinase